VALVIGNGAYTTAPRLPNPRNDAADVAAALKRSGFETIVGIDLDRVGMDEATIRFARAVRDADVAMLYYSGHAMQFAGVNYLMPIDTKLSDEADLRRMTRVDQIVTDLERARTVRILVLDSCRDNPLAEELKRSIGLTRAASMQRGLARIDTPQGMVVAFATQAGGTAADGNGRNSPYTTAFLNHIETPHEIGTVFRRITADVYAATRHMQLPELSISLIGEFYLQSTAPTAIPPAPPIASAATPAPSPPASSEAERTWPFVKDTTSIVVLDDFIQRFGDTIYATIARERREELKKKELASLNPSPQITSPKESATKPAVVSPETQDTVPAYGSGKAWLGARTRKVTDEIAKSLGVNAVRGAVIFEITDYGPGKAVGLQSNDVVVGLDGKGVNEPRDFQRIIANSPAGKDVEIVILRNGKEERLTVKLKDELEAHRKAAEAGDAAGMNNLGVMYAIGKGVAKNDAEALRWFRKAVEGGQGMTNLGNMYSAGRGVAKDDVEAAHLYRKAAETGDPGGMNNFGNMLAAGRGLKKDDAEAVRWYRRAADAGDVHGMANVGLMYENGRGVPRNEAEALRWYRRAVDAGNDNAIDWLKRLQRSRR
jgi:hypothetical protein